MTLPALKSTADPIAQLLAGQGYVARRDQLLAAGLDPETLALELFLGRWQAIGSVVVVAHNGPLALEQQQWAAVLNAGPKAALCGRTALLHHGLNGWDDGTIHVLAERGCTPPELPGISVHLHESRRFDPDRHVHPIRTPRLTPVPRSLIDGATWTKSPRGACGLVVAGVQQRLSTAPLLLDQLADSGGIRHKRVLRLVLNDAAGGAQALSEVDFGRICRRHGLPEPRRQAVRLDSGGRRRYIDVEMRDRRGRRFLVEIDGAVHLVVGNYWRDMARANEIVIGGNEMLRFPTVALYLDEDVVVDQLWRMVNR